MDNKHNEQKFPKGSQVEFTLEGLNLGPSNEWLEGGRKGEAVVLDFDSMRNEYLVKVVDPSDWNQGWHYNLLSGDERYKGYCLPEKALRPTPFTRVVEEEGQGVMNLVQKERRQGEPCPKCGSDTCDSLYNIYCTKCKWKKFP